MQRSKVKFVLATLMLLPAPLALAAAPAGDNAPPAALMSGLVRDAQGVAQMGALIQVVARNSLVAATAFTDIHGRYVIPNLAPGTYQVMASATLFVPALRDNLTLRSGGRTVVNLTLNTLFETVSWLPAERRKADEPGDDWKWTLRSAANRPILRMVEDGEIVLISSSAAESKRRYESGKASVTGGDGSFGQGGVHNTVAVERGLDDGSDVRARVDVGTGLSQVYQPPFGRPAAEVQVGYQRRLGLGGAARTVVSYQSHPEMVGNGNASGLDAVQIASAQRMQFGDLAEVEAGSSLETVRTAGYFTAAHPFVRLSVHPSAEWTLGYRMATARDMQGFNSLDSLQPELPAAVMSQGRMRGERGVHQEVSASRKIGAGLIQASYYRDNLDRVLVSGAGGLNGADMVALNADGTQPIGVIADSMTGSFKLLAPGYRSQGINLMMTAPVLPGVWAAIEYEDGSALASPRSSADANLISASSNLKPVASRAASVALKGTVRGTGTNLRAVYRWQPAYLVTAVDPFAAFSDQAYLSFLLRQPVNVGHWLPAGLTATVDITNLLAQGYRPFLSEDGKTLYLAQAPRSIQAGLAFNF